MNYIYQPLIEVLRFIFVFLFTRKARWFQLHCLINLLILRVIIQDVYDILLDPKNIKTIENPKELYYITILSYAFLIFKNTLMDYFHHSVFVY